MATKWNEEMTIKFVELYKDRQCLWDQHNVLYKNKQARDSGICEIASAMNIEGFGAAEVKAKIKALRSTYNIEMLKQTKSAKSGSGSGDLYVSTIKWLHAMSEVMEKGTLRRPTTCSMVSFLIWLLKKHVLFEIHNF